jgi:hypothetical protein
MTLHSRHGMPARPGEVPETPHETTDDDRPRGSGSDFDPDEDPRDEDYEFEDIDLRNNRQRDIDRVDDAEVREVFLQEGEQTFEQLFNTPRRVKKPHFCPFGLPGVRVPCLTHANGRDRRESIRRHLMDVQQGNYPDDDSHSPINPIWNTWIVKTYYLPKRAKQDPMQKKSRLQAYNKEYYRKRVAVQEEQLPIWKEQLVAGQITKAKYKAGLIGNKRRKVVAEEDVESRIRSRLKELGAAVGQAEEGGESHDLLSELEGLVNEMKHAKDVAADSHKKLVSYSKGLVSYWKPDRQQSNYRLGPDGKWEYDIVEIARGFSWPTEASLSAFYTIAAFLLPVDDASQIYSESHMRDMRGRLHEYLHSQRAYYEGPEAWESLEAVFNESVRLIKEEEQRHTDAGESVRWYEEQKPIWAAALDAARNVFLPTLAGKAPLEVMLEVDQASMFCENEENRNR